MNERFSELRSILKKRRIAFCIRLAVFLALAAMAIVIYILFNEHLRAFIGALILFVLSVFEIAVLFKTKTVKIFGKEKSGVVVSKGNKVRVLDQTVVGGYGSFSEIRPFDHYKTPVIVGALFIKGEDGRIFRTREFNEGQFEFYEVGDEVILLKGAKFPIVTNEPPSRQKWLCPICGTVSPDGVDCPACGLEFK